MSIWVKPYLKANRINGNETKKWLYYQAIKKFVHNVCGLASHNIWQCIEGDEHLVLFGDTHNFAFKRRVFLDFMRYALENGLMKLGKNDKFLTGSIDSQIKQWQKNFPKSEVPLLTEDGAFYTWFFMPNCPAGFVWLCLQDDGMVYADWT